MNSAPVLQDVLLVGGGHSHVILIRMWAMQPLPGVRLTLVSEKVNTPYSGMLPGLIAGHYSEEDVHIDLARLCSWAGVRFIEQRVSAINLDQKSVAVDSGRPDIHFDLLSLDTGSTPELSVAGSEQFSVPVKPVHGFFERWQQLRTRLQQRSGQNHVSEALHVGVIGSGAGGYELVMAMRHSLTKDLANCHWFVRGSRALKGRPEKISVMAMQAAKEAGVEVHTEFDVIDVRMDCVIARDGRKVLLDEIVWCAAAKAPDWPQTSGLAVDKRGFVMTNAYLQSITHDFVFATGDIGTQKETPSNKAGVFAVRQAPYLFQNIRRLLLGKQLKPYRPQTDFLSLMATGKKSAIGNRGRLCVQGSWVWRWKDLIDQKFMNRFRHLPDMQPRNDLFKIPQAIVASSSLSDADTTGAHMRCRGCGGKVGASILDSVLHEITSFQSDGILCGLDEARDAAMFQTGGEIIVQSVDQISSVCDDPYVFGRIAAVHALSDMFTTGANAHSAQVLVSLPFADDEIVRRDLKQLMNGVVDALNEDDCALIGGHTSEGSELSLGFVVNGLISPSKQITSDKLVEGDCLILTKPIGTGVLLAGMMRQLARGSDILQVLHSMQQSNRVAAEILYQHKVKAVTDVTGFGLLGHLHRLLQPLNAGAELNTVDIPVYVGAVELARQGIVSTLLKQNQKVLEHLEADHDISEAMLNLICDPQTSGGLIGVIPASQCNDVLSSLHHQGIENAQCIGVVSAQSAIRLI